MMQIYLGLAVAFLLAVPFARGAAAPDPCRAIAGKRWVLPAQARACLSVTPLTERVRNNILTVVEKTLDFHASENYQIKAPYPFVDTRVNLRAELARIRREYYCSEFAFHLDVHRTFNRPNDGHCGVYNYCYDSVFVSWIPLPLVLLDNPRNGSQDVFIAPEAFQMSSSMFGSEISFWQNALPGHLRGKLAWLSGAKVLKINGRHPFEAVNKNAAVAGGYQSFATRQNLFFASYRMGDNGWQYSLGSFAVLPHPLVDSVELTVIRVNQTRPETFRIPYRTNYLPNNFFRDLKSYRQTLCTAGSATNGHDIASPNINGTEPPAIAPFLQQPQIPSHYYHQEPLGVISSALPMMNVELPRHLWPSNPLPGSYSVARFYMLTDRRTGVLMLGSFSAPNDNTFARSLLQGLQYLKARGATRLIVDVTNNGGGFICIAHWLHRILMGNSRQTYPQAGLDTTLRAGPLAQMIVEQITTRNADPNGQLSYNPTKWYDALSYRTFPATRNWLKFGRRIVVNGRNDAFSERMLDKCQPFGSGYGVPPPQRMFEPKNILILSNGNCGSSCSLFSIRMAKSHGVRTVVMGGQKGRNQDYCGTVGGQVSDFSAMNANIKVTRLKNHPLAPPDFITNSAMSLTWRLGYGVTDRNQPEEWQTHYANIRFPLTRETVNNPFAIWTKLAGQYFTGRIDDQFHVQEPEETLTEDEGVIQ